MPVWVVVLTFSDGTQRRMEYATEPEAREKVAFWEKAKTRITHLKEVSVVQETPEGESPLPPIELRPLTKEEIGLAPLTVIPPSEEPMGATPRPLLRPFQVLAVAKILAQRRCTVVLPTGLGKSLIAMEVLRRTNCKTVVLVPTIVLLDQWARELKKIGFPSVGRFFGEVKEIRPITVMTYQTAFRVREILKQFQCIVFDEVHRAASPEFSKALELAPQFDYAIGLTATINESTVRGSAVNKILPICYRMSVPEAAEKGYLPEIQVFPMLVEFTSDEKPHYLDVESKLQDAMRVYFRRVGNVSFERIAMDAVRATDRITRALAVEILGLITRRRIILSKAEGKKARLLEIARLEQGKMVITFNESVEAIKSAMAFLERNAVPARIIIGETPRDERQRTLREWGKVFNWLLAVRVLDEGWDVPEVSVGVFMESGLSERQMIQRIGRLIRKKPGKIVHLYVLYITGTPDERVLKSIQKAVSVVGSKRPPGGLS